LYDRPTAPELTVALRDWVIESGETVETMDQARFSYLCRVAANALGMIQRELELGPPAELAHAERLRALGCESSRELVDRIRSGSLDDRLDDVLAVTLADTEAKLEVSNPRWLVTEDRGR
jgi:hypothetical protein